MPRPSLVALTLLLLGTACAAPAQTSGSLAGEPAPHAEPAIDPPPPHPAPCSDGWFGLVESTYPVGDDQGHGPDPGSLEWMRALVHQRGLGGGADQAEPGTPAWCDSVDAALFPRGT